MKENEIRFIIQTMTRTDRGFFLTLLVYSLWSMVFGLMQAEAQVVIKIRAINPLSEEAVAPIHYPLPSQVKPSDIIAKRMKFNSPHLPQDALRGGEEAPAAIPPREISSKFPGLSPGNAPHSTGRVEETDFAVKYDKSTKQYYVDHEIKLAPREIVTLEVEVKDVWVIPNEQLEELKAQVEAMTAVHEPLDETAEALKTGIFDALDQIVRSQADDTVRRVGVETHIKAYEKNQEMLRQVEMDKKMLGNLLKKAKRKERGK